MKTRNVIRHFVFMLTIALFSFSVKTTEAQVRPDLGGGFPGDFCRCSAKNYGCGNSTCYTHCSLACKPRSKTVRISKINLAGIAGVFIKLPQAENSSSTLFENEKSLPGLKDNLETLLIHNIEWGNLEKYNSDLITTYN